MGASQSEPSGVHIDGGGGVEVRAHMITAQNNSWNAQTSTVTLPQLAKGDALIRVHAAALNPMDASRLGGRATIAGLLGLSEAFSRDAPHAPQRLPTTYISGTDGSGTIESIGCADIADKLGLRVGDRVQFHADPARPFGSLSSRTHVDLRCCVKIADSISFRDAAAMPTSCWTAYIALFDKLRIQPGMSIFVNGGSGGVGHVAVQLAKYAGCHVIASCSPRNVSFVKSLGADVVLDYTSADVLEQVALATSDHGVDCLLDTVGGHRAFSLAAAVRFGGGMCTLVPSTQPHPLHVVTRQLSIHYVHLSGLHSSENTIGVLRQVGEETLKLFSCGAFRLHLELLNFGQIDASIEQAGSGHTRGKLLFEL